MELESKYDNIRQQKCNMPDIRQRKCNMSDICPGDDGIIERMGSKKSNSK